MARTVRLTLTDTDAVLAGLRSVPGVLSVTVFRGAGHDPAGDVVEVRGTNDMAEAVVHLVGRLGIAGCPAIVVDEPVALVAGGERARLDGDSSEATWEEVDTLLRQDTNLSRNFLAMMALAGAVASVGLAMDQLHVVVGAMLIAPGFEPLVRIAFGAAAGLPDTLRQGLKTSAVGYAAVAAGGLAGALVAAAVGIVPSVQVLAGSDWVDFWSTTTPASVLLGVLAGLAGSVVVNSHQTVFATGVMVALSLVPSMAIVGFALILGDLALAGAALARWAVDVVCVVATGLAVFGLKRRLSGRGPVG